MLILLLLFILFLLFIEFDLARTEAGTGSLLADCCAFVFLLTLDKERVTGWLLANEVSILLIVFSSNILEFPFCSNTKLGSREASGVVRGELEPVVDIGDAGGGTAGSRNGFLVLVGDEENGFDLPMVANFCPELKGFSPFVLIAVDDDTKGQLQQPKSLPNY